MRRILSFLIALIAVTAMTAQTMNVKLGQVVYQMPASQVEEMLFSEGTLLTIMERPFTISDISEIYIDDTEVEDNTVSVKYDGATATVYVAGNIAKHVSATVSGAHVSIEQDDDVSEEITYTLSGSSADGEFYMTGSYKATIELDGLTLTNHTPVYSGAAVCIMDGKRIDLSVKKETENTLTDAATGSQKAALYCKGHLEMKGQGTLNIYGKAAHGIKSAEYMQMRKCTVNIMEAVQDGISCDEYFLMESGTLTIKGTGDDALQCDIDGAESTGMTTDHEGEDTGNIYIEGGTLNLTVTADGAKGMKADGDVVIKDGTLNVTQSGSIIAAEDLSYPTSVKAEGNISISGGTITIVNTADGGKGISADGAVTIDESNATVLIDITANGKGGTAETTGGSSTEPEVTTSYKVYVSLPTSGGGGPGGGGPGGGGGNRGGGNQRNAGLQGIFLQVNYNFRYSHQKNDPLTYDFPDIGEEAFNASLQEYRDWGRLFGFLENPYEEYLSTRLSRYSERTEYGHNINLQLRLVRNKINLNVGVSAQPQRSRYIQQYLGRPVDTVRTVTNYSPTLNMRYRFTQQSNLQVTLRGQTQQPSITQLLNIYDDTNPLSITMGNPGLKPSFTTNFDINYQRQSSPKYVEDSLGNTIPKAQRRWSYSTNASVRSTRNSVGNIVTYNEETGGRISRPENFNGNWSTNGGATFNISLDTLNRWDVSGSLRGSYNHHVSFVNLNREASSQRNVTHSYNFTPSVSLSFRKKNISISLNTNVTYARTENELQASRNLTTWNFQYGGNTKITFSWGTSLSTDFHMYSKRGYSDQSLNTNELLWNAQLSHAFLRGKKLTVMLQWYDILHEQSNFTRTVNANGWTDREVNAITSYAILHLSYRLNMFGGRQSARRGRM